MTSMSSKEIIDRALKELGIKYELTEVETLGKLIYEFLAIYPKIAETGRDTSKVRKAVADQLAHERYEIFHQHRLALEAEQESLRGKQGLRLFARHTKPFCTATQPLNNHFKDFILAALSACRAPGESRGKIASEKDQGTDRWFTTLALMSVR